MRNIRQGLRTEEDIEMFTVLMTCTELARLGDGIREMVVKTLTGHVA